MFEPLKLPRALGDDLVLRRATLADTDALVEFNIRIHSDDPQEPEDFLGHWVRDLMSGNHPTTCASDFTIVEDESQRGKIVSSLVLISQRWSYDGIEFSCGRPELVGTDPDYRRRGLVRQQMEVLHTVSAARGEMVQAITGIPWYYRLFGYEMALDLGGGRRFLWNRRENAKKVEEEVYLIRPAVATDIPILMELYLAHTAPSMISCLRDESSWRYQLTKAHRESPPSLHAHVVQTKDEAIVGYVEFRHWHQQLNIRELAVRPGHPWRPVCLFVARWLKGWTDDLNEGREKPVNHLYFNLGGAHPSYDALGRQLERQDPPYAWYIRVPDLPAFLTHIAPVLQKRLANSVMVGHTGTLRLSFYQSQLQLVFDKGVLQEVSDFEPADLGDGEARFPELTFLQLLFGYRSFEELDYARADCHAIEAEAAVLLKILFPKQSSKVVALE